MANTVVATNSDLNILRVQEKLIAMETERKNLYAGLIGTGPSAVIQRITDLEKNAGDTVKFHLGVKLGEQGINGDSTLEGNEEAMAHFHDTLTIDQKRHAVRLDGRMTEQRSAINLRKEAATRLGIWGRELLTEMITYYSAGARGVRTGDLILPTTFTGFAGNSLVAPDAAHLLIAGAGTKSGLTSGDKMGVAILNKAKRNISLLINSGVSMRPATVNGRKYFTAFMPSEALYDLKEDQRWEAWAREAAVRGDENPLFTGADAVVNGIVIRENPMGVLFSDYGSGGNIPACRTVIMGEQALGIAYGKSGGTDGGEGRYRYVEKEFDYDNQTGFAVATIFGVKKLRFNSKDHGIYCIDTAYTA